MTTDHPIHSIEDLRKEKQKLQVEIKDCELRLRSRLHALEESLMPSKMAMNLVKKATSSPDGMLGTTIRNAVGHLAYNSVFSGYSWPVRMLLTYVSKNLVGNLVQDKGVNYVQKIVSWWQSRKEGKVPEKGMKLPAREFA